MFPKPPEYLSMTSPIGVTPHPSTLLPESQSFALPSTFHARTSASDDYNPSHPWTNFFPLLSSLGDIHSLIPCCAHKLPVEAEKDSDTTTMGGVSGRWSNQALRYERYVSFRGWRQQTL